MRKLLLALLLFVLPFIAGAQCSTNNATSCKCIDGISTNCDLLPDIIVGRPPLLVNGTSGYIEYPQNCNGTCNGNDGRLRLSVTSPNIGRGPLEVRALNTIICGTDTFVNPAAGFTCPNGDPLKQLVVQRVYHKNGNTMTYYDRPAGSMTYHPSHGHMHVDDWGIYTLRTATSNPDPLTWPIVGTGSKLAFCLMDYGSCSTYNGHCVDANGSVLTNSNFPNYGLGGGSYGCSPSVQGISSGYTDIYYQSLDGMWVNLPAGLCNGQYWVVVQLDPKGYFLESNENNNVIAVPIRLTQQTGVSPVITAGGPTTFCTGGSVTLTCNTATTYLWSNGATTKSITVTQSGNYSVTVNGSSTCPATSLPTQVNVNPVQVAPTASPVSVCAGSGTTLNANVTSTGFYTQTIAYTGTGGAIPDNNPAGVSSVIAVSGLTPATLNANSVVSVKVNLTHTYDADLIIQLISPSGDAINLSNRRGGSGDNFTNTVFIGSATTPISSGTAPFTGNYLPEASFSALTGNLNGNWTLKVIDQSGTDSGTLTNWTLTLNRNVATTLSYTWKVGSNTVSTAATPSFIPAGNTTYSVTVSESGTGCTGTGSVAVNVGTPIDVTTVVNTSVCAGSSAVLVAFGAPSYTWSPATGLNTTTGSTVQARPTQTTTYRVVGTNGACYDTAYVTVTVNPLPTIGVTPSLGICAGTSTTLTATGGEMYVWSPAATLSAETGTSVVATPDQTTTYNITGFDVNGCIGTTSTTVTVNPIPVVGFSPVSPTICSGNSTDITANGADTYTWSPADGLNTTTGANVTASPLTNTTYTLTGVTLAGCAASVQVPVTVLYAPSDPVAITSVNDRHYFCSPMTGLTLTVDAVQNAGDYNWTVPAGVQITSGQGTNTITVSGTGSIDGNICVSVTNTCGTSASVCYAITVYNGVPAQPGTISGTPSNKGCPGDTLTLSIAAIANAKTYTWTVPAGTTLLSGQNTTTVSVLINASFVSGNVGVRAQNLCGAGTSRYLALKLNAAPATPGVISGNAVNVCESTQAYSVPFKVGVTYNWSVPANATILSGQGSSSVSVQFLAGFSSGDISVTATNRCGTSAARTRTIKALPKQAETVSGPASVCTGQNGVTFSTPSVAGVTYTWALPANAGTIVSGQGTNSITVNFGTTPRSFNVTVKLSNNCGTAASKALVVSSSNCAKVIDFAATGTALNVHPNPATDYVEVIFNTDVTANAELNITNILGQSQYKQSISPDKGQNSFMVDLRKLPAGVYMISVVQEGRTFTERLIIQ